MTIAEGLYHCNNMGKIRREKVGKKKEEMEKGIPIPSKLYHGK